MRQHPHLVHPRHPQHYSQQQQQQQQSQQQQSQHHPSTTNQHHHQLSQSQLMSSGVGVGGGVVEMQKKHKRPLGGSGQYLTQQRSFSSSEEDLRSTPEFEGKSKKIFFEPILKILFFVFL